MQCLYQHLIVSQREAKNVETMDFLTYKYTQLMRKLNSQVDTVDKPTKSDIFKGLTSIAIIGCTQQMV